MAANGQIQLSKLDLSQFQPYLSPYLNLKLTKGQLSTRGDFNADSKGQLVYQGQADIANLLVKDSLHNKPLVKWQQMDIDSLRFDLPNKQLKIKTIYFNAPYAKVTIDKDKRTNIGELVAASEQPRTAVPGSTLAGTVTSTAKTRRSTDQSPQQPFALDIARINIARGSAYFADNSLTPNFCFRHRSPGGTHQQPLLHTGHQGTGGSERQDRQIRAGHATRRN